MAETHESILLLVYNPMSVKTYHYVRLPAIALHYTVRDPNDEEVEYQLVPLPTAVINLPGRSSSSIQELVFEAESIPPLGYVAFYIAPVRDQLEENEYAKRQKTVPEMEIIPQISNEYLKVTVDKNTGLLESITHVDGMKVLVTQNFFHYIQGQRTLQSGSYSFRPDKERPTPVVEKVSYNCIRGALVKEIRQRFTDWIYQTVRLYRGEEFVELEWVIGPVPIGNDVGKEVVSIFSTNITNHGEFYTDSNMRQMIKRTCWNETTGQTTKKPVASCYYPVTSRLCIHSTNDTSGICVLPDRCQGGTSYNEGEIELMVHRRLLTDDGFGLDETLNEEDHGQGLIIRGKHRILFGNYRQEVDDLTFSERMSQAAYRWQMEPWHFLTSAEKINRRKWQNVRNKRFSALRVNGLPRHVRVLTLEPWKAGSVLLRLENTLEKTDRVPSTLKSEMVEEFPKPFHITVELRKLFQNFEIKSVRETTLAANQWLEEARQMDWSTRYVYSGADDGILPEDLDYTEEVKSKPEAKDSGYSEEDMDFSRTKPRRHQTDKIKSKVKASNFDKPRSKRSINTTENYMENYVNSSENYVDINRKMYTTEVPKISRKVGHKLGNVSLNVNNVFRKTNLVAMTPKSGFYKRLRQKKHYLEFSSSSSEEDVSLRSRKRNRRRNGRRKRPSGLFAEMNPDETDDGVTKSIYEMYYKTKARVPPFKPLLRAVEEAPEPPPVSRRRSRQFRSKEFEELDQRRKVRSKRRDKHVHADMPFFITRGRKNYKKPSIHYNTEKLKPQTDDEEAEKDMPFFITSGRKLYGTPAVETNTEKVAVERTTVLRVYTEEEETEGSQMPSKLHSDEDYYDDDDADDDEGEEKRKKRATGKDDFHTSPEETDADPDYVITLRPTQIRTFVIKFQNNKKNYVI